MVNVVIVGAGGVGGYFAALLAEQGNRVTLVARGATLDAAHTGIRIEEPGASGRVVTGVTVVDKLDGQSAADLVLICVKAWQVGEAARMVEPVIAEHTVIVPVQNGIDAPDRLAAAFGTRRAVGGVCFVFAMRTAPATFIRTGAQPWLRIGALDSADGPAPQRLTEVVELLAHAGIGGKVATDIRREMWRKFMYITSFGGVTTLADSPAGAIVGQKRTWALFEAAVLEVAAVARAASVSVTDKDVDTVFGQVRAIAPDATSSMMRDISAGRPSELFDQNGAVVRHGERLGVPTPIHSVFYAALLPRELRARGIDVEPEWA